MISPEDQLDPVLAAVRATREWGSLRYEVPAGIQEHYTAGVLKAVTDPLGKALASMRSAMATSATDWGQHAGEAWCYGIVVGWECLPGRCEETDVPHRCDESLRLIARRFGWSREAVAELRAHREWVAAVIDRG